MQKIILPKFPHNGNTLSNELKFRVNEYFKKNNISPTGNFSLYFKAIILITIFVITYIHLVFFTPSTFFAILECILLGILISSIGFNVLHDGSHGSFSKSKTINKFAASAISLLGANHFMWNMKHNMIHHTYTNIDGFDDDINVGILMRMSPQQKKLKFHSIQHYYFWVLYMFLYLFWVFFSDYQKYFSKKIGQIPLKKMKFIHHLEFWIVKSYHLVFFVIVPIYSLGFLNWFVGYLIVCAVAGLILSIVFQLAHTIDKTVFPEIIPSSNLLADDFATHQILTTANFATNNKIVNWFVGGLNFQIEHHLFPKISHVHYPKISKIVKEVCIQCNLQYNEYKTTRGAIMAHIRFLKIMGKGLSY